MKQVSLSLLIPTFAFVAVLACACGGAEPTAESSAAQESSAVAARFGLDLPATPVPPGGTPTAGCGAPAPHVGWAPQTIEIDATERSYRLYVPAGYSPAKAHRLVFVWHGLNGTADGMVSGLPIADHSGEEAVLVAAQGLALVGERAGWQTWPGSRDVKLFDRLLEHVSASLCVDRARVFSTGMSDGAIMTNFLGCIRGDVHRGIAPIAGGLPVAEDLFCRRKVAALVIHGTADPVVLLPVGRDSYRAWGDVDNCLSVPWASDPYPDPRCSARPRCPADYPVVWCTHDGAHVIPDFASATIWSFFSKL